MKVSIFIEVFEVSNHPLWVGSNFLDGGKSFLGGRFCLGGVVPPSILDGIPEKGWSPPIYGKPIHRGWYLTLTQTCKQEYASAGKELINEHILKFFLKLC